MGRKYCLIDFELGIASEVVLCYQPQSETIMGRLTSAGFHKLKIHGAAKYNSINHFGTRSLYWLGAILCSRRLAFAV